MREHKYRAWDKKYKVLRQPHDMHGLLLDFNGEIVYLGSFKRDKDRFELMQYTGLKDKNGKEIYEGDIVKNHWHDVNGKDIGAISIVKFGEHMTSSDYYASEAYGWYADEIGGDREEHNLHDLPTDADDGIEVIGSIHENPELLERKEE